MASSSSSAVVCIDWAALCGSSESVDIHIDQQILRAYGPGGLGILFVRGVPGAAEAREALLPLARELARLPPATLARYEDERAFYCIGWSRGREKFNGTPDNAKGSFYANPLFDDPSGGNEQVRKAYPYTNCNRWPSEVPQLEQAFKRMGRLVYDVAKPIIQRLDALIAAERPGHGSRLYDASFEPGSRLAVGRLLHYYGIQQTVDEVGNTASADSSGNVQSDSWCGWHNDNSTITGLVPALWLDEENGAPVSAPPGAGLYVEGGDGEQIHISAPADALGFQIGEAAQILSGGVVHATPHMVRGYISPIGTPLISRETFALFIEPQWDAQLNPPPQTPYEAIFKGRAESKLIPPLRARLHTVPTLFGDLLRDSSQTYYAHNNPDSR